MRLEKTIQDGVIVALSVHELMVINNALNEICHGIEVPEFETRIGESLVEVQKLLKQINELILNRGPV
jgi:hypothetical protein